jgi:acyl-CoA synthetase (AMP-forming)/AMP-acid ligase II
VSSNSGVEYDAMPESAGRTNPTCDIQIWNEHDQPLPDGVEGEVHVRSAYNMLGYWNDADATAKVLKPGGWLATGDIGRFDDGMLTINSRARDMIIRGGENIYPIELERRLDAHAGVAESAVVGVDHDVLGQEVKAIVVPVGGVTLDVDDLARWVAETLAPYKVPTMWELRSEALPRNASGKVLKTVLLGDAVATPVDHRA